MTPLEVEIQKKFSGDLLILMDSLVCIVREKSNMINMQNVVRDLKEIFQGDFFNQVKIIVVETFSAT